MDSGYFDWHDICYYRNRRLFYTFPNGIGVNMPTKITLEKASEVKLLKDTGYGDQAIANMTDTPYGTVCNIVNGYGRWSDIDIPLLNEYRAALKTRLETKAGIIAGELLDSIRAKTKTGSLSQQAIAYGILRTHGRLDAGEATSNIEIHTKQDMDQLDELAGRLASRLTGK